MNESTYVFRIGRLHFIINAQHSSIGYCYPRLFIRWPDNSYSNFDLYLGTLFTMSEDDWLSWLDGTETRLDDIDKVHEVCDLYGINFDPIQEWAFQMLDKHS